MNSDDVINFKNHKLYYIKRPYEFGLMKSNEIISYNFSILLKKNEINIKLDKLNQYNLFLVN